MSTSIGSNNVTGNLELYSGSTKVLEADATTGVVSGLKVGSDFTANGKPVSSLLAEYTVTGSAVTSIDFSGLDINTHKSYRIEAILPASSAQAIVRMFVNNNTTMTNYYTQRTYYESSASGTTALQEPRFSESVSPTQAQITTGTVSRSSDSLMLFNTHCGYGNGGFIIGSGRSTVTFANITQLTFVANAANGFGVGSTIRIYRGDI